jgi:hypothetical protein
MLYSRVIARSQLRERNVVDVDRDGHVAGVDAAGYAPRMDAMPGGHGDAIYGRESVEQMGRPGSRDELHFVVGRARRPALSK